MTSELEDLEQALVMANKVNLAGAPGATKAEAVRDLGRMRNMFDALEAHTTNAFEATREHRAEGHTSVINFQKHHNRVRGPEASRRPPPTDTSPDQSQRRRPPEPGPFPL